MSSRKAGSKLYALSLFGIVSVACGLLVAGLLLPAGLLFSRTTKSAADALENLPAELTITPQMERSRILLKDGSVLASFYDENRVYEKLSNISPLMRKAQVDIEDYQFYTHGAIYLQGTLRALVRDTAGSSTQGGSTLTQQYVKQALIEAASAEGDQNAVDAAQAQTVTRKIRELRYAIAVEKKFTKDQILERYLNIAYYGDGAYGVEAAARHYFHSTAAKLTLAQAAMLAGIVQNPDAYNPVSHPQASIHRRNIVLNRMAQLGTITQAQAAAAKKTGFDKTKVTSQTKGCYGSRFPFICQYAYNTVINNMTSLGKTKQQRIDALNRDGLTIKTVIDPKVQTQAQKGLSAFVAPTDPVISVGVTVQPSTGLITSMAQNKYQMGSGTGQTWINYAVEQSMGGAEGFQAGSTFKAFVMAAALAQGIGTGTTFNAASPMNFSGWAFAGCSGTVYPGSWSVSNSTTSGTMNMVAAAKQSVNTYFVQLEHRAGLCNSIKMAEAAGVKSAAGLNLETSSQTDVPSVTLGPIKITPLSMASAYATFANHGIHCDPIILASATSVSGKAVAVPSANCKQTIPKNVADGVTSVLRQVMGSGGTGQPARVSGYTYQAGKTGTTEGHEAVWLDGYTANVAGVGMIAADKQSTKYKGKTNRSITGIYVHGTACTSGCYIQGHGGTDAGRVWRSVMKAALVGTADTPFDSYSGTASSQNATSLPDISGMTASEARAALEAKGFTVARTYVYSTQPYGTYLGRTYPSSSAAAGSTVYLVYSAGSYQATSRSTYRATSGRTATTRSTATATTTTSTARATATATATATSTRSTAKATATKTASAKTSG